MDFQKIMKEARRIQKDQKIKRDALEKTDFDFENQGISLTVSGGFEVKKIKISPILVDKEDIETLEDLLSITLNQAMLKIKEENEKNNQSKSSLTMIKERLENLAEILRQIPGISKKQAMKILFFLIDIPPSQIENFVNSIYELKKNTQYCQKCGYLNSNPVCEICLDFQRSFKILVVENSEMVTKFEKSGKYDGQYFVFGNYDVKKLENHSSQIKKIADLAANKSEIILAFSSTIDGWVFTNYLAKHELLSGLKITRLATGIPFGASIDYIDSITLDQALENRQEMEK